MKSFIKNTKGAVTVFVSLLIIPSLLLSGTAVDLARIQAARSIVQDANQLAANSTLTQYDALLHDLYGLFGIREEDPALASMVDKYIEAAIFGEAEAGGGATSLKLFYGSGLQPAVITPAEGKNLGNEEVLRRQIEEYMKFRGPVLIVTEIIDAIKGNKLKEDTSLIDIKLEIDEDVADLYQLYKDLYEAINQADICDSPFGGITGSYFGSVSGSLKAIWELFSILEACYKSWETAEYPEDPDDPDVFDAKTDFELEYYATLRNISVLTTGGMRGYNWSAGGWGYYESRTGLIANIDNAKQTGDKFKPKFDTVLSLSRKVDEKYEEISRKIAELERKLENHECSEDLEKALTEKDDSGKSQIDYYKELLKWDNIAEMAVTFKDNGYDYIDNVFKPLLDSVVYRNSTNPSASSLTREQLSDLASVAGFSLSESVTASNSKAAYFASFPDGSTGYNKPPGFKKYSEISTRNAEFYDYLKTMLSSEPLDPVKLYDGQEDKESGDGEKKQKGLISAVLTIVEEAYEGLTNKPIGAKYMSAPETPDQEKVEFQEIGSTIKSSLGNSVMDVFSDPSGTLARAADYILLLTYCTSVFSNYTTTRPASVGKTKDDISEITFTKSITGVPISPEVNYFFQSEWEYLYNGSDDAGDNLSAVTRLIFILRLVCNYITVFRVSEVTAIVNGIRAAFAWCPPVGIVLGELARGAFAAAESALDVARLRSGHKVPLLKSVEKGEWVCSPSGLIKAIGSIAAEAVSGDDDKSGDSEGKGFSYSNYLLFFLLVQGLLPGDGGGAQLGQRTANLIEWNVINYKNLIYADEEKMTEARAAEDVFKLSEHITDFQITTTIDMRMLFLSMPMAQKGVNSVVPPKTFPLVVTDYRGY